jgi:hypothetical protein
MVYEELTLPPALLSASLEYPNLLYTIRHKEN